MFSSRHERPKLHAIKMAILQSRNIVRDLSKKEPYTLESLELYYETEHKKFHLDSNFKR